MNNKNIPVQIRKLNKHDSELHNYIAHPKYNYIYSFRTIKNKNNEYSIKFPDAHYSNTPTRARRIPSLHISN